SLRGLRLHLGRLRRLARNSPARLAASAQERSAIARALAAGDPELAAAAATVHLPRALAQLRGAQTDQPPARPPAPPPHQETAPPESTTSASTAPTRTCRTRASWPGRWPRSPSTRSRSKPTSRR